MRRKQLHCPICGYRLVDAEEENHSELVPEKMMKEGWKPDYFLKCKHCRNQIGLRKIGEPVCK